MRAAVLTNARSRVSFQVSPEDAAQLAKGHPELTPLDFTALGRHEVYASVYAAGRTTAYASGRTRPLPPPTADVAALRTHARSRFGQPLDLLEANFARLLEQEPGAALGATGRRRRQS